MDLDFFGNAREDLDELTAAIKEKVENVVLGGHSKRIKAYFLNGVKVDIVNYDYDWIDDPVLEDGLRLEQRMKPQKGISILALGFAKS